jgi:hypothetical protein
MIVPNMSHTKGRQIIQLRLCVCNNELSNFPELAVVGVVGVVGVVELAVEAVEDSQHKWLVCRGSTIVCKRVETLADGNERRVASSIVQVRTPYHKWRSLKAMPASMPKGIQRKAPPASTLSPSFREFPHVDYPRVGSHPPEPGPVHLPSPKPAGAQRVNSDLKATSGAHCLPHALPPSGPWPWYLAPWACI